jgi:hypothetical protein
MDLKKLILQIVEEGKPSFLVSLDIQLGLIERIKAGTRKGPKVHKTQGHDQMGGIIVLLFHEQTDTKISQPNMSAK